MLVMTTDTNRRSWWRRRSEIWTVVSVLLLGQFVSFILALVNFTSSLSANLVNSAYYFTSITSVALLDCWTVAWVILLTWIFLGTRYSLWQFVGAAICGVGLALVFLSDAGVGGGGGSNPLLGDVLVIGATVFFALSNVGQEYCIKKNSLPELLSMLGLFGILFSAIEIAAFERKNLEAVTWSAELMLTFVGYTAGFLMFYSLTPIMLQTSGATLFNLSLLTTDMWAVIIRIFVYHQKVDWLYYVSFSIVGVGLFIYSKTEKNPNLSPEPENRIPNPQYQLVHEQGVENPDATP